MFRCRSRAEYFAFGITDALTIMFLVCVAVVLVLLQLLILVHCFDADLFKLNVLVLHTFEFGMVGVLSLALGAEFNDIASK